MVSVCPCSAGRASGDAAIGCGVAHPAAHMAVAVMAKAVRIVLFIRGPPANGTTTKRIVLQRGREFRKSADVRSCRNQPSSDAWLTFARESKHPPRTGRVFAGREGKLNRKKDQPLVQRRTAILPVQLPYTLPASSKPTPSGVAISALGVGMNAVT